MIILLPGEVYVVGNNEGLFTFQCTRFLVELFGNLTVYTVNSMSHDMIFEVLPLYVKSPRLSTKEEKAALSPSQLCSRVYVGFFLILHVIAPIHLNVIAIKNFFYTDI